MNNQSGMLGQNPIAAAAGINMGNLQAPFAGMMGGQQPTPISSIVNSLMGGMQYGLAPAPTTMTPKA